MRARILLVLLVALSTGVRAELPDIHVIPQDLQVPPMAEGAPAPGRRVAHTAGEWKGSAVQHTLYLPENWHPGGSWPVIAEYAGNGGFRNPWGDECDGTVEGCHMGYGLSGGRDYIWICLPFVEVTGGPRNALKWWGDEGESVRYTRAAVEETCVRFGGDPARVVLCGFSRGSIGCNFIGLHDEQIARLWCAFLCHSHYDGVRRWPYAGSDKASALVRLERLAGRPQWISQENGGTAETRAFLETSGVGGRFTFVDFPYRNHTDSWALRPCDFRQRARAWLREVAPP